MDPLITWERKTCNGTDYIRKRVLYTYLPLRKLDITATLFISANAD